MRVVAGSDVIDSEPASTPTQTWVQVQIAHEFGSYKAQISAAGARHGARTLEDVGPGCSSLADAMAVTIAIFLDPYQAAARPVAQCAPISVPPALPPKPAPLPKPTRYSRLILDGAGGVTVNVLEHSEPCLTGNGFRFDRHWSLALGGAFVFPDRIASGSGEVELSLAYAYLNACGRALGGDDTAHIDWCAAPLVGSLGGSGRGYRSDSSGRSAWLALAAGPELLFPMSNSWSGLLAGQAIVPLIRPGFDVENAGVRSSGIFRSGAVAGLVSLGVPRQSMISCARELR